MGYYTLSSVSLHFASTKIQQFGRKEMSIDGVCSQSKNRIFFLRNKRRNKMTDLTPLIVVDPIDFHSTRIDVLIQTLSTTPRRHNRDDSEIHRGKQDSHQKPPIAMFNSTKNGLSKGLERERMSIGDERSTRVSPGRPVS